MCGVGVYKSLCGGVRHAFVVECLSGADSVVTHSAESVSYKQIYNYIAVATVTSYVSVEVSACGSVTFVSVNERLSGADGVVAEGSESIFHEKIYHHIAVATAYGTMSESESCWGGVPCSFVGENLSCTNGVVAEGSESVFYKEIYHHIAVAFRSCRGVGVHKCLRGGVRRALVGESLASADGVVAESAESVFYGKIYHQIVQTAVKVAIVLNISASRCVGTPYGIETCSSTYHRIKGVA